MYYTTWYFAALVAERAGLGPYDLVEVWWSQSYVGRHVFIYKQTGVRIQADMYHMQAGMRCHG